jgi:hypothetical protein
MADLENEKKQETEAVSEEKPAKKTRRRISAAARKKFKYGTLATALTCVVIAIVVVINVLVSGLMDKYPLKLDLTESAMFEISDDTIEYLKNVEQDVNLTVLMDESNFMTSGTYMKMIAEILERYAQYSDKVHLTYVDPTTNPDVVNTYQANYSGTLSEGDIVVSNAEDATKMRVVNINDMFTYDSEKYYYYYYYGSGSLEDCITAFSGEQDLTAALMYVTDADPVSVGVLATANGSALYNQSYNYYSLYVFEQTLTKNGYDVEEIDLYTDTLDPSAYDMLVLPAPVNDLTASAVESISSFLYNGGSYGRYLVYFADFTQSSTPNLDEMLESWGLQVTSNLAMEGDENVAQQITLAITASAGSTVAVPVATIVDTTYSENMSNTSLPIVAPLCRTINLLWDSQSSGITSALLQTSDTTYLSEMGQSSSADTDPDGAQTIMAVSTRKNTVDSETVSSSVMVMGSMMLSDYYVMQDTSYNNAEYLISAINTMTGKGSSLIIAEKQLANATITVTSAQLKGINLVLTLIPFVVVMIGTAVFIRRRNR